MSAQRERIAAILRQHPEGLSTKQVAEIMGHERATAASSLSKGVYYGWWTKTPFVANGHHHVLWKAMEDETTGA